MVGSLGIRIHTAADTHQGMALVGTFAAVLEAGTAAADHHWEAVAYIEVEEESRGIHNKVDSMPSIERVTAGHVVAAAMTAETAGVVPVGVVLAGTVLCLCQPSEQQH